MRTRTLLPIALVGAALVVAGCGSSGDTTTSSATTAAANGASATLKTTPEGAVVATITRGKPTVKALPGKAPKTLIVKDLVVGTGPAAKPGDPLTVQYLGALAKTGKVFDASWSRGAQPFPLTLGQGEVIAGWDKGLVGMRVGGRRELIIPADLAYGAAGQPPTIPPNAALIFIVDLISIG